MEGRWRGLAVGWAVALGLLVVVLAASGCGGDESDAASTGAVATDNPEQTFAPLVYVAADEPWRPMSVDWFIARSVLWFADDHGCPDRKIAVGRTLEEQQNPTVDWIYPKGLGSGPTYFRNPSDPTCELEMDSRFYADQLTRPHDPGPRIDGLPISEGYYLDLVDSTRSGPPLGDRLRVPVYSERIDEGDRQVRLTYAMLFGMRGRSGEPDSHEGDWQRVDVLLHDNGDGSYRPLGVQPSDGDGMGPDTAWSATRRVDGTHPVVRLAPATHQPTVVPAAGGDACPNCVPWQTWRSLVPAPKQRWYGFGGAWGQPGPTSATTGPLGPHTYWPSHAEKEREVSTPVLDESYQ